MFGVVSASKDGNPSRAKVLQDLGICDSGLPQQLKRERFFRAEVAVQNATNEVRVNNLVLYEETVNIKDIISTKLSNEVPYM